MHGQAVEQMFDQHVLRVADCGQIVGFVPARHQIQVVQQFLAEAGIQSKFGQPGAKPVVQGMGVFVHGAIVAQFTRICA